ncbi:MAG: hypothetical protein JWQ17_1350 [Tardiphaga sp.]|nr:hypothetical protein [Tardiphaga sp.]
MPRRMSVWPVAIQTRRSVSESSSAQNIEDSPQRLSIDILVDADPLAVTELDLDQAAAIPGRHRRCGSNRWNASAVAAAT